MSDEMELETYCQMLSFSLQSIQDRVHVLINTTNVRNFQSVFEISEELLSNRLGKHEESGVKYHLYQKGYWMNSDKVCELARRRRPERPEIQRELSRIRR
jgi:hypothetical protein